MVLWNFSLFHTMMESFTTTLKVGPFPSDFILPSDPGPFLRADEKIRLPREVVDVLKNEIVVFTCVIFTFQVNGAYPLGLTSPQRR